MPEKVTTLAEFSALVQRHKNRWVAIPAEAQKRLGLSRRPNNHIIYVSIRKSGPGRWNHHYFKLTGDNEFAIPTDVTHLSGGDQVDVKVHKIIPDEPLPVGEEPCSAADLLLDWDRRHPRSGWREDGSDRHDHYLNAEVRLSGAAS